MIETENLKSKAWPNSTTTHSMGGARENAGAKPLPPEQKMVAYKINLLPADWEYLGLFVDDTASPEQRTPGHLIRAAIAHLRLSTPNGPDKPFYTHDPNTPRPVSTTPAVAREATRRGMSKAEFVNELFARYKSQEIKNQSAQR